MRAHLVSLLASIALLTACGGGDDPVPAGGAAGPATEATAQSVSANGLMQGEDVLLAHGLLLRLVIGVVGGGPMATTIPCTGGGSARFVVDGGSFLDRLNGVLDTGERYSIDFDHCVDGAGAEVDGVLELTVVSASLGNTQVTTSATALTITEPGHVLTFNGSSTFTSSTVQTGLVPVTTVTTERWQSAQISFVSVRNGRTSSLTLRDIDLTRTTTTANGTQTSTSRGDFSMTLIGASGWTATVSTQGDVSYTPSGLPLQGSWVIVLPHDRIALVLASQSATVTVDHGPDGNIDRTYHYDLATLTASLN